MSGISNTSGVVDKLLSGVKTHQGCKHHNTSHQIQMDSDMDTDHNTQTPFWGYQHCNTPSVPTIVTVTGSIPASFLFL